MTLISKSYTFASERLRYKGISLADSEKIVFWRSKPENYQNFLSARPLTLEEHLRWFEGYMKDPTRFDFMIIDDRGDSIGTAGVSSITANSCDVSYMIGDEASRGRGYATEALKAMCEIAFGELGVDEVVARILPGNDASKRVALRGGFSEHNGVFKLKSPFGSY